MLTVDDAELHPVAGADPVTITNPQCRAVDEQVLPFSVGPDEAEALVR